LTIPLLIRRVREQHGAAVSDEVVLADSTVHRLLARRGLMRKPSEPTSKDHRRFEYEAAGELWMSDVMYGPKIREQRQLRRTYLIALLDDATRLVPYAAFMFSEGTTAYLQVLEQAILRRGIAKRLYVDNGSAFRSRQLGVVCAKLGIALIHARPYTPQGKGKMERWFRTVRMQHLPLLAAEHLSSLDAMNRALAVWIEGEYHHAPHRGLRDELKYAEVCACEPPHDLPASVPALVKPSSSVIPAARGPVGEGRARLRDWLRRSGRCHRTGPRVVRR